MADIHLNTTGSNTAPYDTWAKAATSWATAVAGMAAGDRCLVDSAFNTSAAGLTLVFPGTPASPNQILSGTPAATQGISALTAGAKMLTSTATLTVTGSFYCYGITFDSSSAAGTITISLASATTNMEVFDTCSFIFSAGGGSASAIAYGGATSSIGQYARAINCQYKFGAAGQGVRVTGRVDFEGGSITSGSTSVTNFLSPGGDARGCVFNSFGFDFSNFGTGFNVCGAVTSSGCYVNMSDFKLPASWAGAFQGGTTKVGCRSEFYAGDNAATSYRFSINDYTGSEVESASIYLTGSTTDGVAISDKITTSANVAFPHCFKSRWLYAYDAGAGSAKTATVQAARDGSATRYNDNEVWLEVECLGTSGNPLGVLSNDRMADVLATPAAQASGAGSWTGLGGTNCKMDLAVAYTPRNAGYVRARVCMAVPSATLYYDPVLTLT